MNFYLTTSASPFSIILHEEFSSLDRKNEFLFDN